MSSSVQGRVRSVLGSHVVCRAGPWEDPVTVWLVLGGPESRVGVGCVQRRPGGDRLV